MIFSQISTKLLWVMAASQAATYSLKMPIFYLNLCNGAEFVPDEEGTEFADAATARDKAIQGLRDILAGDLSGGCLNAAALIEVEDEGHKLIFTVSFDDAVRLFSQPTLRAVKSRPVP